MKPGQMVHEISGPRGDATVPMETFWGDVFYPKFNPQQQQDMIAHGYVPPGGVPGNNAPPVPPTQANPAVTMASRQPEPLSNTSLLGQSAAATPTATPNQKRLLGQ